jgi:hypothetical protein
VPVPLKEGTIRFFRFTKPQKELDRALIAAIETGNVTAVKQAIAAGADPHANGDEAARWAARNGHLHMVKYLIEDQRADPHANGDEAMNWAAGNGHLHVVKYLIERHNADPHALDDWPMRSAAANGHLHVVEHLTRRIFLPDLWRGKERAAIETEATRLAEMAKTSLSNPQKRDQADRIITAQALATIANLCAEGTPTKPPL